MEEKFSSQLQPLRHLPKRSFCLVVMVLAILERYQSSSFGPGASPYRITKQLEQSSMDSEGSDSVTMAACYVSTYNPKNNGLEQAASWTVSRSCYKKGDDDDLSESSVSFHRRKDPCFYSCSSSTQDDLRQQIFNIRTRTGSSDKQVAASVIKLSQEEQKEHARSGKSWSRITIGKNDYLLSWFWIVLSCTICLFILFETKYWTADSMFKNVIDNFLVPVASAICESRYTQAFFPLLFTGEVAAVYLAPGSNVSYSIYCVAMFSFLIVLFLGFIGEMNYNEYTLPTVLLLVAVFLCTKFIMGVIGTAYYPRALGLDNIVSLLTIFGSIAVLFCASGMIEYFTTEAIGKYIFTLGMSSIIFTIGLGILNYLVTHQMLKYFLLRMPDTEENRHSKKWLRDIVVPLCLNGLLIFTIGALLYYVATDLLYITGIALFKAVFAFVSQLSVVESLKGFISSSAEKAYYMELVGKDLLDNVLNSPELAVF